MMFYMCYGLMITRCVTIYPISCSFFTNFSVWIWTKNNHIKINTTLWPYTIHTSFKMRALHIQSIVKETKKKTIRFFNQKLLRLLTNLLNRNAVKPYMKRRKLTPFLKGAKFLFWIFFFFIIYVGILACIPVT